MASNKYAYSEVVKGLIPDNPSSQEDFEHIQPHSDGSSFENVSGMESEEFDLLALIDAPLEDQEQVSHHSSEFELVAQLPDSLPIRSSSDHSIPHDVIPGEDTILKVVEATGMTSPQIRQNWSLLPYGERALVPYRQPMPIYSVAASQANQIPTICSSSRAIIEASPRRTALVKPIHAVIKKKKGCVKCRRLQHRLKAGNKALDKARQEVTCLRAELDFIETQLIEKDVVAECLSSTVKSLANDNLQLVMTNEQLYKESLNKKPKPSQSTQCEEDGLERKNEILKDQVETLKHVVKQLTSQKQEPEPETEDEKAEEWKTATSKKTNRLQKTVTVQKKSIIDLQADRHELQEKLYKTEDEIHKLQDCLAKMAQEKELSLACLKDENEDLHCKIESLEARNQDSLNLVVKVKHEKARLEKQRPQKEAELQERINILEDALEAAKLIRQQRKSSATLRLFSFDQKRKDSTGSVEDASSSSSYMSSTDAHGWDSDELDLSMTPDIASGSPLDLSLKDNSVLAESDEPSVESSTGIHKSQKKGEIHGKKSSMGKKPRKFHFKVYNPTKDYPQSHQYTPRIYGSKPKSEQTSNKKKDDKRASCPYCLMTFPCLVDAAMIQKHIDMHKLK